MFHTLRWEGDVDGTLVLLDQRKLPHRVEHIRCDDLETLQEAIRTLAVRGAPAIGVAAAFGFPIALRNAGKCSRDDAMRIIERAADYLGGSRPTAVNLFHAIDRMKARAQAFDPAASAEELRRAMLSEACAIRDEDIAMCRSIGLNGEQLIGEGDAILTHCNAGALATAGQGTALSPMFEASRRGRSFRVYVDETRPLLQGARLTTWELLQAGIEATLICDNMAGWLMRQGKVAAVFTGADRIAANGDAANKIGTYSLSVLAKAHGVPFYIVAPSSTFDFALADGSAIPIEERSGEEVRSFGSFAAAPAQVEVYNPAFDVTAAANITAIVTERGLIREPSVSSVTRHFGRGS